MKPQCTTGSTSFPLPVLLSAATGTGEAREAKALVALAEQCYQAGDTVECGRLYAAALEQGMNDDQIVLYNVACFRALKGDAESAFDYLEQAIAAGFRDVDHLRSDADLEPLHASARWPRVAAVVAAADQTYLESINVELYELYCADRADRSGEAIDWRRMAERDQRRRQRAREIIDAGALTVADDYYHAALLFQHGDMAHDYQQSWEMARKAVELDPNHGSAPWLSAAARDRYLWSVEEPQVYGTQFHKAADGAWTLEPIAAGTVSDDERRALGVPPLVAIQAMLAQLNETGFQVRNEELLSRRCHEHSARGGIPNHLN